MTWDIFGRERINEPFMTVQGTTYPCWAENAVALTIQQIACHRCDAALAVEVDVCPHCHARTKAEVSTADKWNWIHRRRTLLFVLLCATGALGLPALWLSRAFSLRAKIIWSIIVTVETALLVWICYGSVAMAIEACGPLFG